MSSGETETVKSDAFGISQGITNYAAKLLQFQRNTAGFPDTQWKMTHNMARNRHSSKARHSGEQKIAPYGDTFKPTSEKYVNPQLNNRARTKNGLYSINGDAYPQSLIQSREALVNKNNIFIFSGIAIVCLYFYFKG